LEHAVDVSVDEICVDCFSCDWEKLLTSVHCAIISEKSNSSMIAYVLRWDNHRFTACVANDINLVGGYGDSISPVPVYFMSYILIVDAVMLFWLPCF